METIDYSKLDNNQYDLLSYYATILYNKQYHPEHYHSEYIRGVNAALEFANIPFEYRWAVEYDKIYKGLRNYNKMSYVEIFE